MEKIPAIDALGALAHDTRIDVFRLLVRAGPNGMAAGGIAAALHVRPNTLSNNLNILSSAGLIRQEREGRSIRYFANITAMRDLLGFLMEDCCGGSPERCRPLLESLSFDCGDGC